MEFNNEIIDGQSTVADNLAKSNRNFMLLKELLENGVSQTEMEAYLKVADLVDKVVEIKVKQAEQADTALNSNKLSNLERKDFIQNLLCYDNQTTEKITVEMVKNPGHAHSYMGDINFGKQVNLPGDHNQIIYLKHREIGYSTQIAIPFDGGHFTTMYIRNSFGLTWGKWNDMLSSGEATSIAYRQTYDANTTLESGKLYYCVHNQCQNLPRGTVDDGLLISFMHRTDVLYGFQLYMTWNNDELWTRNIMGNNFTAWRCLSNGKWDFSPENDNTTVVRYLRWNMFGKNHIIFDASKSIAPNGAPCNDTNSAQPWVPTRPNLVAFDGGQTYGVRVDTARTADCVQSFPFRNNNGWLEVLEHGIWRRVTN